MISADEARKNTIKECESLATSEIAVIDDQVAKAISAGLFSITIDGNLSDLVLDNLKANGYTLTPVRGQVENNSVYTRVYRIVGWTISWI